MIDKTVIDARGKNCPIPVIMAKKESDKGIVSFSVLVDNLTAVENLKRFGESSGYMTSAAENGSGYEIEFLKKDAAAGGIAASCPGNDKAAAVSDSHKTADEGKTYAVFVSREGIGDGDAELGSSLLKMFFYTLAQEKDIPRYILFMNSGVKVLTDNDQVIEQVKKLQDMGTGVLVCGTCLNFYGIADKLKAGTVSNMYDIASAMKSSDKVITL